MTDRSLWETAAREHLDVSDVELNLLVEHFLEIRRQMLAGASMDRLIREVDRFVREYSTDFRSLENRMRLKRKQNWYSEKLRSQLEMF